MSIRQIIYDILSAAVIAMAAISLQSCAEERFSIPDYTVSGEDVRLTVPVFIPEMQESTRGDLSPNQLNKVESLWIRTYNAETLQASCDWKKLNPNTTDLHNMRDVTINTQSGYSYIVAVANVDHKGISGHTPDGELKPLSDLLEDADTWDKFLQIAVPTPSDEDDVNAPQSNTLPMCGCYSDSHEQYNQWQTADFQPFFIPASKDNVTFDGGIHLRRLVSHIKFNFLPADDIDLTVNSYQVMNAPKFSWLYERNEEVSTFPNFGDQASSAENALKYYADVQQFGSQFIKEKTEDGKKVQTFDFWQAENKHTGTCSSYADRGLKTTSTDGDTLFTSLTGDTWTPNNEASYVVVDCDITYKHSIIVDADGNIVDKGSEVERSGNATYFIHLGYILGDDPTEKAKDFNCFRNVDYTYNVTVNGIDDIRVDAVAETERYHNEEGLVVDLDANPIKLDAHYAVFNIYLSDDDLKDNFGFIITTYDNGQQITLSEKNPRQDVGNGNIIIYEDENMKIPIDQKYYNWIELRATKDEDTLAEYKPRYGANSDGKTFLLTDLYNDKDEDGNNKLHLLESARSASGYYTVFVNEYTYEPMYTGSEGYANEATQTGKRPSWMNYVNQNPRRFYIKVSYRESNDHNSVYARSKYAVQQQSLMTYYSQINRTDDGTAIGVERDNETLGFNLRHRFWGGKSYSNGRWNTAQYIDYTDNNQTVNNPSLNGNVNTRPFWSKFLEIDKPLYLQEVPDDRLQGGPAIPSGNRPMRKLKTLEGLNDGNNPFNFTDPQPSNDFNIEYIATCLARNRDNNGNGRIDPDELRWYVPAINNYIELTLGSSAMNQPLMEVETITRLPYVNDSKTGFSSTSGNINNTFYSRYMFVASNVAPEIGNTGKFHNNVLWAIEGSSLSAFRKLKEWSDNNEEKRVDINPWQIRCIRNLGSNLTTVENTDKVTPPYVHKPADRKLIMNYFNLASIRTKQYSGNGKDNADYMPVHTINSPDNRPYAAFEYAADDKLLVQAFQFNDGFSAVNPWCINTINSNPCKDMGSGWRVPNQIELTMMMNVGLFKAEGADVDLKTWLSCTANYFNFTNGLGSSNDLTDKYLLISFFDHTSQLASNNFGTGKRFYIRCVRDVQP